MPALLAIGIFGALALRLFWTVVVACVAAVVVVTLARSIPRLRRLLKRARYRLEVADFRWRDDIDPIEFERRCAESLRLAGWSARTTKGSGDQGVDVLAERGGIRIAIQCKRYGRTVGNKAVQEALSGKAFYDAQHGIVVSNAEFSAAARQLAAKTGIALMHFTDLRHVNRHFGLGDPGEPAADATVRRLQHRIETRRHWLALSVLMGATAVAISLTHDLTAAGARNQRARRSPRPR